MNSNYKLACADIARGIASSRIWSRVGWQEVKRRYRRTVLGPLWLTLSLGMFVCGMGFIWAPLFNVGVSEYLPFITTGMICWTFVSTMINEGCGTYTGAESLIKQFNFTLSTLNMILVWRNIIVLFHNLIVAAIVYLALLTPLSWNMLLFFPGVLLVAINGLWISILMGMFSARFRDVPQFVANVVQVMMFVTPVFWYSKQLGTRGEFILFNPLFHIIDVIRAPLLGHAPSVLTYGVNIGMAVIGWSFTLVVYARLRHRIAYWV